MPTGNCHGEAASNKMELEQCELMGENETMKFHHHWFLVLLSLFLLVSTICHSKEQAFYYSSRTVAFEN
jgi:hypothetical protein